MNAKSKSLITLLSLCMSMGIAACSNLSGEKMQRGNLEDAPEFVSQKFFDYQEKKPIRLLNITDGYSNNNGFGTTWVEECVTFDPECGMKLSVVETENEKEIKANSGDPYLSGEIRTATSYRYGFFGTYMKPSPVFGTASTFFLYADNPHDEIDIEFLGKDTTKVQFNYFKNGKGGNEYFYDLGFDASKEFHHYGFYWGRNELTWYVDFKPVYRLVGNNTPTAQCQLLANIWVGDTTDKGIMNWMGKADPKDLPTQSLYKSWEIADEYGNMLEVRPKGVDYDVCPKAEELVQRPVTFRSLTGYTMVNDTSSTNEYELTWTREQIVKNYQCLKLDVEGIENNKWIEYTITNKSTDHPVLMRLNVVSYSEDGTHGDLSFLYLWKNHQVSDQTKIGNGTEGIVEINAGETATFTARWFGANANSLTFMFDDFGDCKVIDNMAQRPGHIIIKDYKFGGVQDFVPEDTSGDVTELYTKNGLVEDPESEQAAIPQGYQLCDINFASNSYYTVSKTSDGTKVDYDVGADNYDAVQATGALGLENVTRVLITIKNMNKKDEYFQLKMRDSSKTGVSSQVNVLSSSDTGRFERWSSSNPGLPYFTVSGQRTCQLEFVLNGTVIVHDLALIASVGKTASKGTFIIKSIYRMVGEN